MVGEQPGRIGPVARRLRVPDGLDHLAMPGEPSGGPPVQRRHFFGQRPAQLQPQQIREQVVVAKPRCARGRATRRTRWRPRAASRIRSEPGRPVSRSASSPLTRSSRRGAQQQILDVGRLALQHLGDQVLGDRAVAAGELRDETLRVGVTGQGDRREPQARGPPFRPLVQQRCSGVRQRDARGVEKLAGFALGEAQVGRADLG